MINLNYLRYFYICAQAGTFTKAASQLRISQPSLSIQIKTFEQQLGFPLFTRNGRTIQLTAKGQALFLYASKIFELSDDIERFLSKNKTTTESRLNIGVSEEVERPFVAEIVGRLIKVNSSKNLIPSIISMKNVDLIGRVAEDEIDLMITNEKNSNLKLVNTLNMPVMLISANSVEPSKISSQFSVLLKTIDQKLILPTDEMILAKETKRFLKKKDFPAQAALTSNIIACISRSVQEGLGAALLPAAYVQRELKMGTLKAYGPKDGFWFHPLYVYTSKNGANPFVSSLSKILQDFGALKFDSQIKIEKI